MIGWEVPKKKRRLPVSEGQQKLFAKQAELRKIKKDTNTTDALNLYWAEEFLRDREKYGETSIQVKYAIEVMKRLRPETIL